MTMQGKFVWYELMTTDIAAAATFYADVVGWTMADSGMPGITYTLAKAGAQQVAGLMGRPPEMPNAPSAWFGYIATDDVDAMAKRVTAEGGKIHREPGDIPGVGRFAVCSDPQGAAFMLFKGAGEPPPQEAPGMGMIGWHELHSKDWEKAFGFYSKLFGWTKAQGHDMGPMGMYQTFNIGDVWTGGMMNAQHAANPFWLYYFNVGDIAAAAERVTKGGGTIMNGPMEVPGGGWVLQANDPQGVMFALFGSKT